MKKINVNKEACIGCGMCIAIDGEHFDFDENSLSEVINNENIETEDVKNAMKSCPTSAISYVEESENNECSCNECHCDDCHCEG